MALEFLTTSHCTLCDQAEALLQAIPLTRPIAVDVVDIAQDAALLERYGERIPVLRRTDNQTELDWPFTQQAVITFLQAAPNLVEDTSC